MALTREAMAQRAAQELHDSAYANPAIGLPALVASFVPDGMDAWYRRSQTPQSAARRLASISLADVGVFTGTLGLALCNPLHDGIRPRNLHDREDAHNPHLPGIYTQSLVIDNSAPAHRRGDN